MVCVSCALRMPIMSSSELLSGHLLCIVVLGTALHHSARWQPAPCICNGINLVTQGPLLQVKYGSFGFQITVTGEGMYILTKLCFKCLKYSLNLASAHLKLSIKRKLTLLQSNNPTGEGWKAHWLTGYK